MTSEIALVGLFKWRVAQAEIACELSSKDGSPKRDAHRQIAGRTSTAYVYDVLDIAGAAPERRVHSVSPTLRYSGR